VTHTMTTVPAIERRLELRADPERVWRALSRSEELAAWFSQRADMPGGVGQDGWLEWDGHGRFAIRVEVIDPPHRLVWRWMDGPDATVDDTATTVDWRLEPAPGGGTILHLRESGFATVQARAGNAVGWLTELAELVGLLAIEPWERGIRRTYSFRAAPERVWAAFADPAQFGAWFGGETPPSLVAGTDGWFVWPAHGRFAIRVEVVEPPIYLAWRWTTQKGTPLDSAAEVLRTEWALEPRGDGGTALHLFETGFIGPDEFGANSGGWDGDVVPALRRLLGEEPPSA
jgi:uncharacterized protein YndB with AHSA1/START domain